MASDLFQLMMGKNKMGYGSKTMPQNSSNTGFPSTVIGDAPGFNPVTTGDYDQYDPYGQVSELLDTRNSYRNLNVANILGESEKDYTNIFAAGPSDALVDAYRNRQGILDSSLQGRGLEYTGAKDLSDKALQQFYGRGVTDITRGSEQQELGRQAGLIQNLQGIMGEDAQIQDALSNIYLQGQEVRNQRKNKKNADMVRDAGLYKGIVQLGASILGAGYGATGGLKSTTGATGGLGALQGANMASSIIGGGSGANYQQNQAPPGSPQAIGFTSANDNPGLQSWMRAVYSGLVTPGTEQSNQLLNAALASVGGY